LTKIIKGTFQPSRNPKNEAEFSSIEKPPKAPAGLGKWGKWMWEKLIGELSASGVATNPDLIAFELLCQTYDRYRTSRETLKGKLKEKSNHMAFEQMNADLSAVDKLMGQFGLTPSTRNKFGVSRKKNDDPDIEKMKGMLGA
jgi:P27 family predicted phage terminase small subunit